MSLEDTLVKLNALNEMKSDGDLIIAQEWNDLVGGVKVIGDELQQLINKVTSIEQFVGYEDSYDLSLAARIAALEGFVGDTEDTSGEDTLAGRVKKLEETDVVQQDEYDEFKESVNPLLDQYIVELETSKVHYLLGDNATITATVRNLDGSIPANRPWIDFIASWGRLRPVGGFIAREGTGNRSISVRTNSQGIAQVQLSAEQNTKLSVESEAEVASFFQVALPTEPISFGDAVMGAINTQSEYMDLAYKAVSTEYESNRNALQWLVDDYYLGVAFGGMWGADLRPQNEWRDYRSIVIAFAKNDSNPTTPDRARGVSSIQVRFRDWIGPWIDYYFNDDLVLVEQFEYEIKSALDLDLIKTFAGIQSGFDAVIQNLGIVGRQKGFIAFGKAADRVDDTVFPGYEEYEKKVKDTIIYAAETQKSMDILQFTVGAADGGRAGEPAIGAFFDQAKGVAGVSEQVGKVKDEVFISDEFQGLMGAVGTLQNSAVNVSKDIMNSLSDIENKVIKINAFDSAALQTSVNQIKATLGITKNIVGNF